MKTTSITLLLASLALLLAGCNTTRGLGQDIEAAGDTIEEAAEDTKDRMSDGD